MARIAMLVISVAAMACAAHQARVASMVPLFDAAVGRDAISGRVDDEYGGVWLMVGQASLVHIEVGARRATEIKLQVPGPEPCWGLARLSDGSLWTLNGRERALQIGADGRVVRQVNLPAPHLSIFSAGNRLVLQRANLPPKANALFAARPDGSDSVPWSGMTVRPFERLVEAAAAALNLVSCGTSQRAEVPCWFPDEAAVSLITPEGKTTRRELAGIAAATPEVLINASVPQRPVRDALLERDGTLWILSTGTPVGGSPYPGGWILARFGPRGESIDSRRLPESVRAILAAGRGRAVVLTGAGRVAEVQP